MDTFIDRNIAHSLDFAHPSISLVDNSAFPYYIMPDNMNQLTDYQAYTYPPQSISHHPSAYSYIPKSPSSVSLNSNFSFSSGAESAATDPCSPRKDTASPSHISPELTSSTLCIPGTSTTSPALTPTQYASPYTQSTPLFNMSAPDLSLNMYNSSPELTGSMFASPRYAPYAGVPLASGNMYSHSPATFSSTPPPMALPKPKSRSSSASKASPQRRRSNNASPGPIPATIPTMVHRDANGVDWIQFVYSKERVKTTYTIRCDIESVNTESNPAAESSTASEFDSPSSPALSSSPPETSSTPNPSTAPLSDEFKRINCIYPRATVPPSEYKGNRQKYETECNYIGWCLAALNPILQGQRGLIQRAVDSWRNTNANLSMRSRRVRRMGRRQEKLRCKSMAAAAAAAVVTHAAANVSGFNNPAGTPSANSATTGYSEAYTKAFENMAAVSAAATFGTYLPATAPAQQQYLPTMTYLSQAGGRTCSSNLMDQLYQ